MKLLLDTHTVLWFYLADPQLSGTASAAIVDPVNEKWVSPASYWEVAIKISTGNYAIAQPFEDFWRNAIDRDRDGPPVLARDTMTFARGNGERERP